MQPPSQNFNAEYDWMNMQNNVQPQMPARHVDHSAQYKSNLEGMESEDGLKSVYDEAMSNMNDLSMQMDTEETPKKNPNYRQDTQPNYNTANQRNSQTQFQPNNVSMDAMSSNRSNYMPPSNMNQPNFNTSQMMNQNIPQTHPTQPNSQFLSQIYSQAQPPFPNQSPSQPVQTENPLYRQFMQSQNPNQNQSQGKNLKKLEIFLLNYEHDFDKFIL
jgi:hypothetical protein